MVAGERNEGKDKRGLRGGEEGRGGCGGEEGGGREGEKGLGGEKGLTDGVTADRHLVRSAEICLMIFMTLNGSNFPSAVARALLEIEVDMLRVTHQRGVANF